MEENIKNIILYIRKVKQFVLNSNKILPKKLAKICSI